MNYFRPEKNSSCSGAMLKNVVSVNSRSTVLKPGYLSIWKKPGYTLKNLAAGYQRHVALLAGMLFILAGHGYAQDFSDLKNKRPFSYSGSIDARSIFYSASGIANRRQPFSYLLSGNPTFDIYGLSIPVSFSISESDRSFRQPFNQFGMSPTYKWITLHAGYRNISFSPYTLGGHTMLGAGFELNPGKLRAGFMYGRLNRATTIDTTTQALVPFSFSRKGYAARLGYGSDKNFFELSYLHAKDDSTTGPSGLPPQLDLISPAKNDVLGYSARFTFLKNFSFESDGAISLYTTDINSNLSIDSIENRFIKKARDLFGLNATSEYYTAFSAALGYKVRNYGLKVNYKRIEPDFQTMGAYYFNSDLENWTVSPSGIFANGRIRFSGNIGLQHDNLKNQKRAKNQRLIASANAGFEITKSFGLDIIYTNFSDNQKAQTALFADSLRIVQTTQTFGIMPRYFIVKPEVTHVISASVNLSSMNDYNNFFSEQAVSRNITTNQYFINYSLSFPKKQLSLFLNLNSTRLKGQGMSNTYSGATVGGNMAFLNQKLQTGITGTFTNSKSSQNPSSLIINASGNVRYQVLKKQTAGLSFFVTDNKTKTINLFQPSFTETRAELSYQINF